MRKVRGTTAADDAGAILARARRVLGTRIPAVGTALAIAALVAMAPGSTSASAAASAGGITTTPTKSVPCAATEGDSVSPSTPEATMCGTITVTKTDSSTQLPLAGAQFSLYGGACPTDGPPDSQNLVNTPSSLVNPVTTDSSGSAVFTPVYPGVAYCVWESTPPTGYTASISGESVTIAPPTCGCVIDDPTISFTDSPEPSVVTIEKTSEAGAPLAGATFTLESGSPLVPVDSTVASPNACTTAGTTTATCTITVNVPNNASGVNYTLVETGVPSGYQAAANTPITVAAGSSQTVEISDDPLASITPPTAITPPASTTPPTKGLAAAVVPPVTGATSVHTGEPFAGSAPYVVSTLAFGSSLVGLGLIRRRRQVRRLGA